MSRSDAFSDKVVLITGGTSGIGLALARTLRAQSARVIICARSHHGLQAAEAALPGVCTRLCDITQPQQVASLMNYVQSAHGRLDILINNAGRSRELDFREAPFDDRLLTEDVDFNLTAHIRVTNRALPVMRRAQRPAIVFIGSGYGLAPARRAPLYSASKAGLRAFAKALRMQAPVANLKVLEAILPTVDTPATAHRAVAKLSTEVVAEAIVNGLRRGKTEVFLGQARWLPLLLRLAPARVEALVGRT